MTVFTFLWACQALVHQEFYSGWLHNNDPWGWAVTVFGVAALLLPRSLPLFACLLISSVIYNVVKWPFVVNHIFLESLVNVTILLAIITTGVRRRSGQAVTKVSLRDEIFDRFAPVLRVVLIVMYYFAFLAKLNWDFFDPRISSVSHMYQDLLERFPFLSTSMSAKTTSIWLTVVVEAAIPILLSFRRTRLLAFIIGLPFHFMLGLIGHRTFSAFAFAFYGLFCIDSLTILLQRVGKRLTVNRTPRDVERWLVVTRCFVVVLVTFLLAADLTGNFRAGVGPFLIFRIPWAIWGLWSMVIAAVYVIAMVRASKEDRIPATGIRPGVVWLMVILVVLNGASQYLGFKTETCFTMYSNLRTEGDRNNHLFMPALRLADYQDDLVDIVFTDHPDLQRYIDKDQYIVYFELQRTLRNSSGDVNVSYVRNGTRHTAHCKDGVCTDPSLTEGHSPLLSKLLYFRPVYKGHKAYFQH